MAFTRKALRLMPPKTRRIARILNDLESVHRRLKNQVLTIREMEIAERAEAARHSAVKEGQL